MNQTSSLILATLLTFPTLAFSCDTGCEKFKDQCVCDAQPYQAEAVKPSDEKPPKSGMPSWQVPGMVLVNPPNTANDDAKQDREKAEADAQGKRAAGIER